MQNNKVLTYLKEHGSITSREAFGLGVTRLASVISRLKATNKITTVMMDGVSADGMPCRYARYFLEVER